MYNNVYVDAPLLYLYNQHYYNYCFSRLITVSLSRQSLALRENLLRSASPLQDVRKTSHLIVEH